MREEDQVILDENGNDTLALADLTAAETSIPKIAQNYVDALKARLMNSFVEASKSRGRVMSLNRPRS